MKKEGRTMPPIVVMYGDSDWMDSEHSMKVNRELELGCEMVLIEGAGH